MIEKMAITIIDTFKTIDKHYSITNCRNGFMIEVSGHDQNDSYVTERFIFNTLEQLQSAVQDLAWMPKE
jgi:hypothetical protein